VDNKTCIVINPVIKTCKVKAGSIKKLFNKVIPKKGAKRTERYEKALRSLGKGSRIKDLMGEILEKLQLLVACCVFANATKLAELAAAIKVAIEKLSEIQLLAPDSIFDAPLSTNIDHHGDGIQNNIIGPRDHKIFNNTGKGNQAECDGEDQAKAQRYNEV
jgi:alkaline phosphatase